MAAAGDNLLLGRRVPLYLGARAFHPQQFRGQGEARAIVEGDVQHLGGAVEADFGRVWHHASSGRASSGSVIGMPSRTG